MGQPELSDYSASHVRSANWEMGQPELRDFSASHVRFANSASWSGNGSVGKWVSLNCAIFPLLMSAPQTAPVGSC
jgi:hypothetical protein